MREQSKIFAGTGPRERVGFLDELRGLSLVLMVIYHGAYDIIYIFGWDIPLFHWAVIRVAQPFFAGVFIFISGVCCRFSRSNVKRGAIALALGLAMSAFTLWFMPSQAIYFGILHFLGVSMILFGLAKPLLDLPSPAAGVLVCVLLYLLTFGVRQGYLGLPGLELIALPASWARNPWLIPLGFAAAGADHVPLLPWLFVFVAGSYVGVPFALRQMPDFFYRGRSRFLAFVGRHSIWVYVLHQPVVYGILYAFFWVVALF